MTRSFVSPSHYVQAQGALDQLGPRASRLGSTTLLVADDVVHGIVRERVETSFETADATYTHAQFAGECTEGEIDRLSTIARERNADVIVGAGGGKALDVAKAVRGQVGGALISLPTVASTDAPTSGLSVVYHDDGRLSGGIVHDRRPDVVLVDTAVVANAPVRWFVSGVGDALATRFEAEATLESGGQTFAGGTPSGAGLALANQCYDVLRSSAQEAVDAVREGAVTEAVESTTEAIVLLSGLGFENGGLAAAHAVHDGIATTIETDATHGEKVCFGLLTQLVLEDTSTATVRDIAAFASDIGLPVTLAGIGAPTNHVEAIAEAACGEETSITNQPGDTTPADVVDALFAVDELGQSL